MVTKKKKQNPEANPGLGKFSGTREDPKSEGFRQITDRPDEGGAGITSFRRGGRTILTSETGGSIEVQPGETVTRKKTGRGTIIRVGEVPDFSIGDTLFSSNSTNLPPEDAIGGNVDVNDPIEQARQQLLSPQERLEERKDADFQQGLISGSFNLLNEQEVNERLGERGLLGGQTEGGQTEGAPDKKGALDTAAEVGVAVPVALANLISKGLSLTGVDIGTITREEFASTGVGKALGLSIDVVGLAGAGYFAASLLPSAAAAKVGTLTATQSARAVIGTSVIKTGALSKIGSSKLLVGTLVTGWGVSQINGRIGDLENSIVNQRETLTLITSGVRVGVITPTEAILLYNDIEADINATERAIHATEFVSTKAWLGKGKEVETRIQKARSQLLVERGSLKQIIQGRSQ
mgnify:CR=1 FL=1